MKKINQKYGNQYNLMRQKSSRWVATKREFFLLKVGPLSNDKQLHYIQHYMILLFASFKKLLYGLLVVQ